MKNQNSDDNLAIFSNEMAATAVGNTFCFIIFSFLKLMFVFLEAHCFDLGGKVDEEEKKQKIMLSRFSRHIIVAVISFSDLIILSLCENGAGFVFERYFMTCARARTSFNYWNFNYCF